MTSLSEKRRNELERLSLLLPPETDLHSNIHGVLLSDEIEFYALQHSLITPFDRENLKPAAYELTIGDEYFMGGRFLSLNDDKESKIIIPPFEVAVIKTGETLCLPRFLIARWNIRVRHAYAGLLWVGAPQVDPGYVGHLFCPLYNLSDKPYTLNLGDPFAVMDFVKTTPFDIAKPEEQLKRYTAPGAIKRPILEDFGIDDFRSALFTRAGQKITEFEKSVATLERRFAFFTQIIFTILALLIAVVATISKFGNDAISFSASFWGSLTIGMSVFAVMVSIFSFVGRRVTRLVYEHQYGHILTERMAEVVRSYNRAWLVGVALSMLIAGLFGWSAYRISEPFYADMREKKVVVQSDLENMQGSLGSQIKSLTDRIGRLENNRQPTR